MSLNRHVFANISKYPSGGQVTGLEDDIKAKKEDERKKREASSLATLEWLKANQNPNWPKNFDRYLPREGASALPSITKDNRLMIPGATNFNLNDYSVMEIPDYNGYPIYDINGKWIVGDNDFNQQYAQPYQRRKNSGDIVIQYGNKPVLENGGETKHLIVKDSQENSVSLSNTPIMKKNLFKAQEGMEAPQGQPQEQPQGGGDPMQQVMQMAQQMVEQGAQPADIAAQLLQQGVPPEAIMQVLVQMGMPEQEAQAIIQQVMEGGQQSQGPGEEQMEGAASNPQEEAMEQPPMAHGGETDLTHITSLFNGYHVGDNSKSHLKNQHSKMYADGGEPQGPPQEGGGDQMAQVMQMAQQMAQEGADPMQIAQALMEQGVPPEAVAQVLVQLGMPQEQVQQVIEQAMQGGQGAPQEGAPQGQPPMAKGGGIKRYANGGQQDQQEQIQQLIMAYAQMTAQSEEEMQQVAQQIMQQLQEAKPEDQQQMLQQIAQAVQEGQGSQGQSPQGMASMEDQMAMMLGGTKKDFNAIRKKKIKEFRKGGMTDADSLDKSSTAGYVGGLTEALRKSLYTGFAIGSVNDKYGEVANMFDAIPKAVDGIETGELTDEQLAAQKKEEARQTWIDQQMTASNDETWDRNNPYDARNSNQWRYSGNQGQQDHYYQGWNAQGGPNRGGGYYSQRASMSPFADVVGAFGGRRPTGQWGFQGTGDMSDATMQQFMDSIGKTHEVTSTEPLWKKKRFGKNKGEDKRHSQRNWEGVKVNTRLIGSGNQDSAGMENSRLNAALAQHNSTIEDYNTNPELKREVDRIAGIQTPTGTPTVTPTGTSVSQQSPTRITRSGALQPLEYGEDKWADRQNEEVKAEHLADAEAAGTAGPLIGDAGYSTATPEYTQTLDNQDAWDKQAIEQMNLPAGTDFRTLSPEQQDVYFSIYDPLYEAGQMAHGGELGSPFKWDSKQLKFIRFAESGADFKQGSKYDFNAQKFAEGMVGLGHKASGFMSDMNAYLSDADAAKKRGVESLVNVADDHSGQEGVYWRNLMKQMAQDTGADVLPGTGTDWAGFRKGTKTFKDSFISGAYKHGGLTKAANGMQKDAVKTLNDAQRKMMEKAGYVLKQQY